MSEEKTVELEDLIGDHVLSGVDFDSTKVSGWNGFEDCQVINFVLDDKTYTAIEDPGDGYRSSMDKLFESGVEVKNMFAGQPVFCSMRPESQYGKDRILDMLDKSTGKVVLSVGTDDRDGYYPVWVADFNPENMAINSGF